MTERDKRKPLFTREDYTTQARILGAAAAIMDGRSGNAKMYRKVAAMLVYADVHMPKGLPR